MAIASRIISWALENKQALNLRITRFRSVEEWLPGYFDFRAEITVKENTFRGSGFDRDVVRATEKAVSEAIERAVCAFHGIPTNGVACHVDELAGQVNAKRELIERDTFLAYFFAKSPGQIIIPRLTGLPGLLERLAEYDLRLKFLRLPNGSGLEVCLAACTGMPEPAILGLGNGDTLEEACEKALGESIKNTLAYIEGTIPKALSLEEFSRINAPTSMDKIRLYLHPEATNAISFLFNESPPFADLTERQLQCELKELEMHDPLLKSAPVRVFRAQSASALTPEVAKRSILDKSINQFPHPVG